MNIYTPDGEKVRFVNHNGHEWERKEASKIFRTDRDYTIRQVNIGGFSSSVEFEEVLGSFNTVMFENVNPDYIERRMFKTGDTVETEGWDG